MGVMTDLDGGVEDVTEVDGVLQEAVDVEHGGVGASVGDVIDMRHHLLVHPRHRSLSPGAGPHLSIDLCLRPVRQCVLLFERREAEGEDGERRRKRRARASTRRRRSK